MAANGPVSDFAVHAVRMALMVTSAVWIGGFILAASFARGLMAAWVLGPSSVGDVDPARRPGRLTTMQNLAQRPHSVIHRDTP